MKQRMLSMWKNPLFGTMQGRLRAARGEDGFVSMSGLGPAAEMLRAQMMGQPQGGWYHETQRLINKKWGPLGGTGELFPLNTGGDGAAGGDGGWSTTGALPTEVGVRAGGVGKKSSSPEVNLSFL